MKVVDEFIRQKPDSMLYHYTNASGLIGILKTRSIWATSHLHLNDGQEFEIAAQVLRNELTNSSFTESEGRLLINSIQETQKPRFILSFSQHGDLLSQWRAYCHGGDGYALGFSVENPIFRSERGRVFNLIKCEYDQAEQRKLCKLMVSEFLEVLASNKRTSESEVSEQIRTLFKTYNWAYALALFSASFKHKGFSEEGEWRFVSQYPEDLITNLAYRNGRFGVTPYYPLPLSVGDNAGRIDTIVIGPTANKKTAMESLQRALKTHGFDGTEVHVSDTPLRQ